MVLGILFVLALSFSVFAGEAEERGLKIATEVEARDNGFNDFTAAMSMVLKNRHGDESVREIRSKRLEAEGDGDKILSIFDRPRDVKGTAFLSFTHKVGNDDQWLYLPALKRVKRISSANKSGSFMGSEFAYEDITSMEIEKYGYKYLRDDKYGDKECFVVEYDPVDPNSGYTRIEMWIDKDEYIVLKSVFFDRKNSLMKTLTYSGYKKYIDKYWRPDEMYMENHQTGKSTSLIWSNYEFKTGLSEKDFNKNALKRVR